MKIGNHIKDIKPYNKKYQRHGYWEVYYVDGRLMYSVNYINDKMVGYFEFFFYEDGQINSSDKAYYIQ